MSIPTLTKEVLQGDDDVILLDFAYEENGREYIYTSLDNDFEDIIAEFKYFGFSKPLLTAKKSDNTLLVFENILTIHIPSELTRKIFHPIKVFIKLQRAGLAKTRYIVELVPKLEDGEYI